MSTPSTLLRHYPPFDQFEAESLAFLDTHLQPAQFPSGTVLISPEQGEPHSLYIVAKGKVRAIEANGNGVSGEADLTLSAGECFPIGALSGRRVSANIYSAMTPLEAYLLPAEFFHQLVAISPVFTRYCSGYLATLVSQSRKQLQAHFSQQASEQHSLNTPLIELIKRAPISVNLTTTIQRGVEIMGEHKTGSVIVVNGDGAPIGLMTQSDVVRRVVLGRVPLDQPITEVMSHHPATLPDSALAYDAMFAMASRGIRHLLLVDEAGRLSGVISERDLFALQRVGLGQVRRAIESAENVAALKLALRDVQQSAFNMMAQGVGAEQLTQFISTLNDAVTDRVLELNLRQHMLDDIEWCWLAFGSEGREEQTLSTDQDNGIVFLPPAGSDLEACRQRLLAFAQAVNQDLDGCGFPLCKGNIMAGNPEWCLSLEEWKKRFSSWINNPHPPALLNATIFFDFRPLHGRRELADRMHEYLSGQSKASPAFQRMLAQNALSVSPPLGLIRDFVTETDDNGRAFIDLKKSGARLFVDAARVMALAHGTDTASTIKRLRRSAKLKGGAGDDTEALIDAFNFIQLLRLRHQHLETGQGRPGDNRIFIDSLNQLDRRILKEAFRQAKSLQMRLKVNYQL
jgi:CBS domain-containing protein